MLHRWVGRPLAVAAPVIAVAIAAITAVLLVALHTLPPAAVRSEWHPWANPYQLTVCPDAPDWVTDTRVRQAIAVWKDVAKVELVEDRCPELCLFGDRWMPCTEGRILITLRDGDFATDRLDETHQTPTWATVMVPAELPAVKTRTGNLEELLLAHLLGHTLGYKHSKTQLLFLTAYPSGQVMSYPAPKMGWGMRGLR